MVGVVSAQLCVKGVDFFVSACAGDLLVFSARSCALSFGGAVLSCASSEMKGWRSLGP